MARQITAAGPGVAAVFLVGTEKCRTAGGAVTWGMERSTGGGGRRGRMKEKPVDLENEAGWLPASILFFFLVRRDEECTEYKATTTSRRRGAVCGCENKRRDVQGEGGRLRQVQHRGQRTGAPGGRRHSSGFESWLLEAQEPELCHLGIAKKEPRELHRASSAAKRVRRSHWHSHHYHHFHHHHHPAVLFSPSSASPHPAVLLRPHRPANMPRHRPAQGMALLLPVALWIFCHVNPVHGALPTSPLIGPGMWREHGLRSRAVRTEARGGACTGGAAGIPAVRGAS
ncbi:unnamed protein product, partial [Pleuronectes platessa]